MASSPSPPDRPLTDREFAQRALLAMTRVGLAMTEDLDEAGVDAYLIRNHPMATLLVLSDGPMRPVELAERVGMTSGGMTKVIDRLQALGLVDRDADAVDDGRGVLVTMTAEGYRALHEILDVVVPALRKSVAELRTLPG